MNFELCFQRLNLSAVFDNQCNDNDSTLQELFLNYYANSMEYFRCLAFGLIY